MPQVKDNYLDEFDDSREFSIMCLSPLDGRYARKIKELRPFLSEFGLIHFRVMVEVKWFLKLSEIAEIKDFPALSEDARSFLKGIVDNFSLKDALEVKKIEQKTNHDVKAIEYFLKQKCQSCPEVAEVLEFFHFACTSEDINNLAYALLLKESLNTVIFPTMVELYQAISSIAKANAHIPMLSRTHGQPASPTTLGKEMANFAVRLGNQGRIISGVQILGKFAGAVGNYNAHKVAYPSINWPRIAEEFVTSLGIGFNPYVTQACFFKNKTWNPNHYLRQKKGKTKITWNMFIRPRLIEPHDYISNLFYGIIQFNSILIDFDRDIWSYVSLGYFKQITKPGEVGSSTMPHKVNPIDFENSEGNLCLANAVLSGLAMKLPISRMQRDLTDSTVLRNIGVGLGYSLLAYLSAVQGIQKLQVNESRLKEDLEHTWEVLAEAIQTVMRRYGIPEPYEKLKELTRGRAVTKDSLREFTESLELPEEAKLELLNLTPHHYTGEAENLARAVDDAIDSMTGFRIR
ncbi:adenylosuccinate lyase [Apostasia shenzhenica]|uniref:Adenylosuccinate lyase n=1 Tax=Apostasia shenzhenica TaxID=1088818 RepID=A0A2I0AAV0_9ASPA|nr:adenylosuccinate lyase [Apostasia shenzhenica]